MANSGRRNLGAFRYLKRYSQCSVKMEDISTYVIKKPTYGQVIDKYSYMLLFIKHIDQITGGFNRSICYIFDY